eukprot:Skav225506  [mRNA]  locus=scaffold1721:251833:255717:- [translate_table: standard]
MAERARSVPAGPVTNPFYSERVNDEIRMVAARPADLPEDSSRTSTPGLLGPLMNGDHGCVGHGLTGKGRGSSHAECGVPVEGMGTAVFVTPPPKRSTWRRASGDAAGHSRGEAGHVGTAWVPCQHRSEGAMPVDEPKVMKTMGKLAEPTEKPHELHESSKGTETVDQLQRELEKAMLEELRQQNEELQQEVVLLKRKMVEGSGDQSSTSWSTVSDGNPMRSSLSEPMNPDTKKTQETMDKLRHTPGGTRVPDGEPPGDDDVTACVPLPPLPPPLPPMAPPNDPSLDEGVQHLLSQYEPCHVGHRKGRRDSTEWVPSECGDTRKGNGAMSTQEARTFWLEREVQALQQHVNSMKAAQFTRESQYWQRPFQGEAGTGVAADDDEWRAARDKEGGDNRACLARDIEHGDNRARLARDTEHGDNRARLARDHELGDYRADDRARGCTRDRDRARSRARDCEQAMIGVGVYVTVIVEEKSAGNANPASIVKIELAVLVVIRMSYRHMMSDHRGGHLRTMGGRRSKFMVVLQSVWRAGQSRRTSSTFRGSEVWTIHSSYSTCGPGEKQIILQQLVQLPKCVADWTAALRSWRRHYGRAQEVDANLPDSTLLLRALDPAVTYVGKEDAQAGFRLAQSRVELQVDERPCEASVWSFSQCILAELETMMLRSSSAADSTAQVKIKQLDGANDTKDKPELPTPDSGGASTASTGKGKGASIELPCKWFKTDAGCRAGKQCKWIHDLDSLPDKSSRCWVCGSKQHRKNDCPVRGGAPSRPKPGDGGPPSGGGKKVASVANSSSTASTPGPGGGKPSTPTKPKINEMTANSGDGSGGATTTGSGGGSESTHTADTGSTKVTGEELLKEATQLLKALRGPTSGPQIKVIQLAKIHEAEDGWLLLDSGATHSLRPARSVDEWNESTPTSVALAEGVTDKFRLKPGTKVLLTEPGIPESAWIVPMGGLNDIGYSLQWKDGMCVVTDEREVSVPVQVRNGCPMFSKEVGEEILQKMEDRQIQVTQKLKMVRHLLKDPSHRPEKLTAEIAVTVLMNHLFPDVPEELMAALIPSLESIEDGSVGAKAPWNRRCRRRLEGAKHIVFHLFSGKDAKYWHREIRGNGVEILCLDILDNHGANLLDKDTFAYVVSLVMTGRVRAIIGGPPCRSVSA